MVPDPIQAGRCFLNRKNPTDPTPVGQGSRVRSHRTPVGCRRCWGGLGVAQEGAGSVGHRVGDEQLSCYGSGGVSLVFRAAPSVTVPSTHDLAQGRGFFPRDHGQRRALDRAVGHVGHRVVPRVGRAGHLLIQTLPWSIFSCQEFMGGAQHLLHVGVDPTGVSHRLLGGGGLLSMGTPGVLPPSPQVPSQQGCPLVSWPWGVLGGTPGHCCVLQFPLSRSSLGNLGKHLFFPL